MIGRKDLKMVCFKILLNAQKKALKNKYKILKLPTKLNKTKSKNVNRC